MPQPTSLLTDPAADLHSALDVLGERDLDRLDGAGRADLLRSVSRAEARLAAFRLQIVASAERTRTAAATGAASTAQWVAQVSNADHAVAHRHVGLAQGLEGRTATRRALSSGLISPDHAAVIVATDRTLPPALGEAERAQVETALVAKAAVLSPSALRRAARRALAEVEEDVRVVDAHEDAVTLDEEDRARTKVRFTMHDNGDGTVSGHFTVPTAQGHLLGKILQTITAPRRGRLGATEAQIGPRESRTDWDRARGEAFCELIEHLPTDHLHPRTAATLVVTVSEETLRGALKAAHLDTGAVVSSGEARRLACTARLLPAVLGGASLPLDLGRSARLFSETQRTALGLVHSTCAADGCERPFAWCELHHLEPWSHGGPTDLTNAVPLCHAHHQRIHDQRYAHARTRDGSITFTART